MSSKALLNIFLAISLVGLLALAFYEPGKTETPPVQKLTTLDIDSVKTIVIKSPAHGPVQLNKLSGKWQMQSPLKMPANAGRIQQLIKVLRATSIASYDLSQVDINQLQLGVPALTLEFDDVSLQFGGTDALGGSRYVQVDDRVHLITDRYSYLAKGAATNFISPKLLPEKSTITELALPNFQLALQGKQWLVDGKKGDADAIQALLDEWRHARALQVTELAKTVMTLQTTQPIVVTLGDAENKQILSFSILKTESEVIFQLHAAGVQYHFPLEAGERLLSLAATRSAE